MFITDCYAYTDITAELTQYKEYFVVILKVGNDTDISLTLNYMQAKVLADGLLAIVHQAQLKELLKTKASHILGDIKVKFNVPQDNTINNNEGVEEICQQNILSVQTEKISLSETA